MGLPRVLSTLVTAVLFLSALPLAAQNLSTLGDLPDYRRLDTYQEAITREEFTRLLETLYAPHGGWQPFIRVDPGAAVFRKTSIPLDDLYTLRFAASESERKPLPSSGFIPSSIRPSKRKRNPGYPLLGLRVALDPGHIGGEWAPTEERWFRIGDAPPVMEGEMTLRVAVLLYERLQLLGAEPQFVRENNQPCTSLRPVDLTDAARRQLAETGVTHPRETSGGAADPERQFTVSWTRDMLFTRADIRARAGDVNRVFRPDLTVCLHFNAEAWGDPANPALVDKNHLHVLVNGCYGPDEIAKDDVRLEMLLKLLNGSGKEELAAAEPVATALAAATGLPPYQYTGPNAIRMGGNPYVWARNLLANRLYECPVVYTEPYVMNSPEVFARVQAGDYEGTREFGGVQKRSIFREYADAVAEGLCQWWYGEQER